RGARKAEGTAPAYPPEGRLFRRRRYRSGFQLAMSHRRISQFWVVSQFEIPVPTQTGPSHSASLLLPGGRKERAMPSDTELLEHMYDRFNARDMEAVLATMHRHVMWANGMEGGHVYGK